MVPLRFPGPDHPLDRFEVLTLQIVQKLPLTYLHKGDRMILDRLETLAAISFIEPAIPKDSDTGKNCLFVRVDEDKLIFTGGGSFVTKKVVMVRPNTVEESARPGKKTEPPKTFMIPRADLFAFKEMMKEHKADCKKLAKNDPSYLFVEMDDTELISHDGKIVYEQPKYEFKDLESAFQITREAVSEIPVISADILAAVTGFRKSKSIDITFTGHMNPIHFQQDDYEAVVIPPVEKEDEEDGNEQENF